MSEPRKPAAAGSEFTELWGNVSKRYHSRTQEANTDVATSPVFTDLQSPNRRGCSRYSGLNNGDSPGDGEASQDIFWDSTSPSHGWGLRNNRVVEISDIVNRIAPKDVRPKGNESPLLQWIGANAVPCTPEIRRPKARKKSSRRSCVEDLMKLARQFDKSMQQNKESSEQLKTVNNNLSECVDASKSKRSETSLHSSVKCPSSSDQMEAELHALFDCSTQGVSGRLSQSSSASVCSPETKDQLGISTLAEPQQSEHTSADRSDSDARPAEGKASYAVPTANNCDDFDDDWDNDDLLNDSFVLAITQNPEQLLDGNTKTTVQSNTKTNTNSAHQPSHCSALQQLCPEPKTTNRCTFKLEPNPHFQSKTAAKEVPKSSFTVIQPKLQLPDTTSAPPKTRSTPQADQITNDQRRNVSDSLWDDGEDDALLYQVCDSVERISNSQPQQLRPINCQQKQDIGADGQRKTTTALPADTSVNTGASADRQSPRVFVRSNSLPGASWETMNYQGWNVPMGGANNKSQMSQSLPRHHATVGTFGQCRNSSGSFQDRNANVAMTLQTVTAGLPQTSKSHRATFKRNVSDSAAISNKVFVMSQMTGKCSAAEIERKKQEALARRRLRMENAPKP